MAEVVIGQEVETGDIITIGDRERCGGFYILGEPRTGKSHLMISMALQDMKHNHPVLFIDPHRDAITEIIAHLPLKRQQDVILLDPSDKDYSFGLNPLHCKDPHDPMELDRVYGRVQDIFIKLWGNEQGHLGLWVEKILRNAVYLLLENPGYTLVDMPLLLSPDTTFRNALLKNVTMNPDVKDFWFDEFDRLSPRDKTEQVGPLLSRLDTFRMRILRHIVGQTRSTIDFQTILNTSLTPFIVLLRMPVNLPDTVRSAIGTMLISEMVAAAFDRDQLPEDKRRLFAVYCDEFQMFATQDFAKLITQTGKFKLMPHVAHQVREGQLKPDDPNTGATLAAPNKAFFSLSITDSPKVAPLMSKRVEPTEIRREAELVLSPRPVEDLWERGHPQRAVMDIRGKYFWIVERLRNKPNEQYFMFDPFQVSPQYRRENPLTFQLTEFDDWEFYRASADQLRRGIALLNQYYYNWMGKRYDPENPLTEAQVELMFQVIECVGGLFGFFPTMQPFIPDTMRQLLYRQIALKRPIPHIPPLNVPPYATYEDIKYAFKQRDKAMERGPTVYATNFLEDDPIFPQSLRGGLPGLNPIELGQRERLYFALKHEHGWQDFTFGDIPRIVKSRAHLQETQQLALWLEIPHHDIENLVEWEAWPLERTEKGALAAMMTDESQRAMALTIALASLKFFEANLNGPVDEKRQYSTCFPKRTTRAVWYELNCQNLQRQRDRTYQIGFRYYDPDGELMAEKQMDWVVEARWPWCWQSFACGREEPGQWDEGTYRVEIFIDDVPFARGSFSIVDEANPRVSPVTHEPEDLQARFRAQGAALSQRLFPPGLAQEKASRRVAWQMAELKQFINACFRDLPPLLSNAPVKVPSGKYDESLRVERTQQDLINEMALELSRLPRRAAYVHVAQEHGGIHTVRQAKIRTLPHDPPHGQSIMDAIIERSHEAAYTPRAAIEAEIRQRQSRWRRRGDGSSPPPTHLSG